MRRAPWLGALAVTGLALALRLLPQPAFESLYGRGIYPTVTAISALLTGWTWLPLGLIGVPVLAGWFAWRALSPRRPLPFAARALRLGLLALTLLSSYYSIWGANYRRPPARQLLGVQLEGAHSAAMEELNEYLLDWIDATVDAPRDEAAALTAIATELEELASSLGFPARVPNRVKLLAPGMLLSAGYAGMIFPFTVEPQIDAALVGPSRVAVAAHEMAHTAGFASEQDADLIALLAALGSGEGYAGYSLALALQARIAATMSPPEQAQLLARLPERANRDLAVAGEVTARYRRAWLTTPVTLLYDRFLERQGVTGGVAQYGYLPRFASAALEADLLPPPPGP